MPDEAVTRFHGAVLDLAVELNGVANRLHDGRPNDIVHDAMFVISHDAICVHRAIGRLAASGWPAPGSVLVRTLLDLAVSGIALNRSRDRTAAAFRFMYSGLRDMSRNLDFPQAARRHAFSQLRERLRMIKAEKKPEILRAIRDRSRPYWFAPEWKSPAHVLEDEAHPDLAKLYRVYSAVAHGGYLGMRFFREDPDKLSINPEKVGPRAASLDMTSSRVLLAILGLWTTMEGLGLESKVRALTREIDRAALALRGVIAANGELSEDSQ